MLTGKIDLKSLDIKREKFTMESFFIINALLVGLDERPCWEPP